MFALDRMRDVLRLMNSFPVFITTYSHFEDL
jgi:hypothetical protein